MGAPCLPHVKVAEDDDSVLIGGHGDGRVEGGRPAGELEVRRKGADGGIERGKERHWLDGGSV